MAWETITLDCYGTLIDWEAGIGRAFAREARRDGLELEPRRVVAIYHQVEPELQAGAFRSYREILGEAALRVAARLGWRLPAERAGFLAASLPDWPVFPDTRRALQRLGRRYQLAILSNVDDDLLAATLARLGVRVDWTVTAEQVRSYKPGPAHFEAALRRLGGQGERLLHAAQSLFHDIRPASAAGLACAWVNRKREPLPADLAPRHVVNDLNELAEVLGT
ncbi:MAG: haloacid dehalogenase [Planctomycetota bacterium]|nr:MAG: haloacid dehalogenase [Planctomycetota bacterium]